MLEKLYNQLYLTNERPYALFSGMFHKGVELFPDIGFQPLLVTAKLRRKSLAAGGRLKLERAEPPEKYTGLDVVYETEGFGGKLLRYDPVNQLKKSFASLPWRDDKMAILADATLVAGTVITIPQEMVEAQLVVRATAGNRLRSNLFRLRRAYDTQVTAEVIGTGNGTQVEFTATLAQKPICPSSLKVTFTDSGGVKTDLVRDTGKGKFATLPPNVLVEEETYINYTTGDIKLTFTSDHVPAAASNITIDYEYSSEGIHDEGFYELVWEHGNG